MPKVNNEYPGNKPPTDEEINRYLPYLKFLLDDSIDNLINLPNTAD